MRIYVGVGHGITTGGTDDPGAVSGPYVEHVLNRRVAVSYSAALTRNRVEVVDEPEPDRDYVGTVARANAAGVDYLDEIHHDAGGGRGTAILVHPSTSALNRRRAAMMALYVSRAIGVPNRGVLNRSDLYVLNASRSPATIPEIAFVDNVEDQRIISAPDYAFRVGEALARGTCEALGINYAGAGGIPGPDTDPIPPPIYGPIMEVDMLTQTILVTLDFRDHAGYVDVPGVADIDHVLDYRVTTQDPEARMRAGQSPAYIPVPVDQGKVNVPNGGARLVFGGMAGNGRYGVQVRILR